MTKKQYEVIIGLLADKVKEQERSISIQEWQIKSLTKQLEEAEALLLKKETQERSLI